MRYQSISRPVALCVLAAVSVSGIAAKRHFTVRDSIEFSTFVHAGSQWQPSPRVSFSPDGKHFVVVTRHGDLATGKRVSTMWLFSTRWVREYLSTKSDGLLKKNPQRLFSNGTLSNREPISDWRWASDSKSIYFLGADDSGKNRLYREPLAGGTPKLLSLSSQDVSRFDESNGAVAYLAHKPIGVNQLYQAGGNELQDIVEASGKSVLALLFPYWLDNEFQSGEDELWTIVDAAAQPVKSARTEKVVKLKNSRIVISPDGKSLIATVYVKRIPKTWERYQPLEDYPGFKIVADTPNTVGSTGQYRPQQYARIDLKSGAISLLVNAPITLEARYAATQSVAWSSDASRVALFQVYPVVTGTGQRNVLPCEIAVVTIANSSFSCLKQAQPIDPSKHPYNERKQLTGLAWTNGNLELSAFYATPNQPDKISGETFVRKDHGWQTHPRASINRSNLSVEVRESISQPPRLQGRLADGVAKTLLDPNPQLKEIALGHTRMYDWHDKDGDKWTGALVTPPDFSASRRYPLVIQTHQLDRSKFLVNGPSATGFAALALAGRGIVVLQVDEKNKNDGTPKESESGAQGYLAGIRQLVSDGIVDPHKVGIITWSHMGPYAMQALLDKPHAFAAATFAEAAYNGYGEYLMNIDYMGSDSREKMMRAQYGPKPFGKGLKTWVEHAPNFHTNQLCTPILFQINSPVSLVYTWDAYAALRAANRPVDLFYIRNGEHVLVKPKERLAEQGMNVDWYDYWLNGHRDPDPRKAKQYQRWRAMRDSLKALPNCGQKSY